jgi:hypothetical protein
VKDVTPQVLTGNAWTERSWGTVVGNRTIKDPIAFKHFIPISLLTNAYHKGRCRIVC